jgi:hypothetical protein
MRKRIVFLLALLLTACGVAPTPAPTPLPPPTAAPPEVVVVTVVVPATPMPQPTQEPPTPVPQVIVVTATPEAPQPAAPAAPAGGLITIPDDLGGGFFKNITISGDTIKLRCEPSSITFTATALSPYIVSVELWYRMQDQQGTYITEWKNRGAMQTDNNGNYTLTFQVLDIHPDLRYYEKAWMDFEFIGYNKQGDVVGRSQKIVKQITYFKECK